MEFNPQQGKVTDIKCSLGENLILALHESGHISLNSVEEQR